MFQNSAARLLVPAIRSAMQSRCQSVVSGPPTKHISTAVSFPPGCITRMFYQRNPFPSFYYLLTALSIAGEGDLGRRHVRCFPVHPRLGAVPHPRLQGREVTCFCYVYHT